HRRGVAAPESDQQRDSQTLQPRREVRQPPQRWLVPPVRLVNSHEKRPLGGEVRSQPVEAVQDGKRRVVSSPLDGLAEEQCPDRSSGAGKKRLALVDPRGRQAPLEELANEPERELGLEPRPARAEHVVAAFPRALAGRLEERRLPDTCRSLKQKRAL